MKDQNLAKMNPLSLVRTMAPNSRLFIFFNLIFLTVFYGPLNSLSIFAWNSELYSYILGVPFISGYFFYLNKKELIKNVDYSPGTGSVVLILGSLFYMIGVNQGARLTRNDYLSVMIFSAVITWIGGFILSYGLKSVRTSLFPFLFLFFMVPFPELITNRVVTFLQTGSTEIADGIFGLLGVPVYREGFVFHFPSINIEVAEECSGIRSAISLLITSIIVGKMFLRTGWSKVLLTLSIFPIAIFKNGLRVVTLSLLGAFVDERILGTAIHKKGGIPFFLLALLFLFLVLWLLKKTEKKLEGPTL